MLRKETFVGITLMIPSWIFVRGLKIIRRQYCKTKKTTENLHQSHAKTWRRHLQHLLPNQICPKYQTMRRMYAKYAVKYFSKHWPTPINETTFTSFVLGHVSMEPALSYTNINMPDSGKLNIFEIGKHLKIKK